MVGRALLMRLIIVNRHDYRQFTRRGHKNKYQTAHQVKKLTI
ncbi:hypothetical protein QWZ13_16000 [Reinekea marina]|nr:hypothetical protein [Reinekea marina]MDN3650411.1 hypothetical protein [Reinekea marina]